MTAEIKAVLRRSWQAHFWTNFATTGVLALSFGLILGTILLTGNLKRLLTVWGDEIQITIYLKDDITQDQKQDIEKILALETGVEKTKYMDKTAAADSFEKSLKSYGPNFLKSLKSELDNPFPASYLVQVTKAQKTPEKIEALAKQFTQMAGVEDVSYGQEWLRNYTTLVKLSRAIAALFVAVILIGCLFTVSNSIRASLSSRREEIEILELVGATSKAVRTPFLIEGAFQGMLAVIVALILLNVAYRFLYQILESVLGASAVTSSLSFLPFYSWSLFILAGAAVGAVGSYLCVARLNTGWAAAQESKQ